MVSEMSSEKSINDIDGESGIAEILRAREDEEVDANPQGVLFIAEFDHVQGIADADLQMRGVDLLLESDARFGMVREQHWEDRPGREKGRVALALLSMSCCCNDEQ